MSRAVLSIGSNLGDRLAHLRSVVAALHPVAISPVYERCIRTSPKTNSVSVSASVRSSSGNR